MIHTSLKLYTVCVITLDKYDSPRLQATPAARGTLVTWSSPLADIIVLIQQVLAAAATGVW